MFRRIAALALAAVVTLLFLAPMAPTALAAKEPEKVYVLLSEKLGYDQNLLLEEVPAMQEGEITATYKSEYAKTATIEYYDNGAFKELKLTDVNCVDGTIDWLVYQFERELWSYSGTGNDDLSVEYSVVGRLMGYGGWIGNVYCRYDSFGELEHVSSDDNPNLTIEDVLASDLALPELAGDPYDCGFETLAPPITIYAQFPELGIDFEAARDIVPEPGELELVRLNNIPAVLMADPDEVFTDVTFTAENDYLPNVGSHYVQNSKLPSGYWFLTYADRVNFDLGVVISVSVPDAQGNLITASWNRTYDAEADEVKLERLDEVTVRFPQADDHGFTSVTVNLKTGEKTLRAASGDVSLRYWTESVRCEATYKASGALTGYKYRAYDGQTVRYDSVVGREPPRGNARRRALYPALPMPV